MLACAEVPHSFAASAKIQSMMDEEFESRLPYFFFRFLSSFSLFFSSFFPVWSVCLFFFFFFFLFLFPVFMFIHVKFSV